MICNADFNADLKVTRNGEAISREVNYWILVDRFFYIILLPFFCFFLFWYFIWNYSLSIKPL